jgi:hypothetical protein
MGIFLVSNKEYTYNLKRLSDLTFLFFGVNMGKFTDI